MSGQTVREFAETVHTPVDRLLVQMREAGISLEGPDDIVSEEQKTALLNFLRRGRESDPAALSRVTLTRRSVSTLKVPTGGGRGAATVNVEVRQKKTYVRREVLLEEEARQREVVSLREEEKKRREEEEQRAEEQRRQLLEQQKREEEQRAKTVQQQQRAQQTKEREELEQQRRLEEERRRVEAELKRHEAEEERRQKAKVLVRPAGARGGAKKAPAPSRRAAPAARVEEPKAPVPQVRTVAVPETITVAELAQRLSMKAAELIKAMFGMGLMVTINQSLDQDTAALVVQELGHKVRLLREDAIEETLAEGLAAAGEERPRPPVITVMGHVDHGKTSLLDYIRRTRVAASELGGITQHIGAYHVETPRGLVTFLDTPGHAAFTAMRARGARATDIVVLVVAADDGVMPQTVEAIEHARAASVPIVVAVNKIDKSEADPERVRRELAQHGVVAEDWGGENIFVHVSAKTGQGVDDLLEAILVQAEVLELKAPVDGPVHGVVLEASVEAGRGPVATVLVQRGTLRLGDIVLAGQEYGRVRAMLDELGHRIEAVGPSMPAQLLGLSGAPEAGETLVSVADERKAREVAAFRERKRRTQKLAVGRPTVQSAADLFGALPGQGEEGVRTLGLIVKADVQGSAEALRSALLDLPTAEIRLNVISCAVGGITENDVTLAATSRALVLGFNVRATAEARRLAAEHGVDIRYYGIIYEVLEDVRTILTGMLRPEVREKILGVATVKEVFRSPKFGVVAGCLVSEGRILRGRPVRILRDDVVIFEGELESLRRHKDDVAEVASGVECGIGIRNYTDIRPGDQIEVHERVEVARSL
jgi:translation initiation factor IF-2